MSQQQKIIPFSLRDSPSLIESVLPVQKLSVDVYKERMAGSGQTLTGLGSYWKGRKPLVLNKACILGCLLPATKNIKRDLEVFELLMGMDEVTLSKRYGLPKPKELLAKLKLPNIWDYFDVSPPELRSQLPHSAPFILDDYKVVSAGGSLAKPIISWRKDLSEDQKHSLACAAMPSKAYRELATTVSRVEEINGFAHSHIWEQVNSHLGTDANSFSELINQLGIMRFGRRPVLADTFSGSGQIPFEAARLGCDVIASDLNPIACMLTWGAFNIVGSNEEQKNKIELEQRALIEGVRSEIDALNIETDGKGWRGKVYLYCLEITCPETGWRVPLLPSLIISQTKKIVCKLVPDELNKRYRIDIVNNASEDEMTAAKKGSYQDQSMVHTVGGIEYRSKIATIRGDFNDNENGKRTIKNKLRQWEKSEVMYRSDDIFSERLYAIQWIRDDGNSRSDVEFRGITAGDEDREEKVNLYVKKNIEEWQKEGLIPDMKIEPGDKTDEPIRTRGWAYWHQLFNPRQLLLAAIIKKKITSNTAVGFINLLNWNAKLSIWNPGNNNVQQVFANQALNPLYNYGCRGSCWIGQHLVPQYSQFDILSKFKIINDVASGISDQVDIFVTDPPYGDAVKYEEILEFFIAWLRKNPPKEFSDWIWDSRRALAIKGEDHDFKLSMVDAYKNMTLRMPDNGIQVIMFTHQSGSIWADMANIVWASGLQVTAAWYVVTETDSALREGQYVKGTILLILRKRLQSQEVARDELAYELADEVKKQVDLLTGLNRDSKDLYKDENLFEDADLQMAGYAAALRVLTRYKTIDGVDMPQESLRPRVKGQITMVDELIEFAVNIANEYLVPEGMDTSIWEKSAGIERLYLKMLDMESKGIFTLSNYQNFAKAFKVRDDGEIMNEAKANKASLKTAKQLGKKGMNATDEFGPTILRSILYAIHILEENKTKPEDVLHQLRDLVPDYYRERNRISALAEYISKKTTILRPEESSNAIVLRDLVRREKV